MCKVMLYSYCGMAQEVYQGDYRECRRVAANKIRRHDGPVRSMAHGRKWELETPETACMVSDDDGILEIVEEEGDD